MHTVLWFHRYVCECKKKKKVPWKDLSKFMVWTWGEFAKEVLPMLRA
jgi:hypothetical protein